jgi:two-component system OmpR family response regulator
MERDHVLVVDDDAEMRALLAEYLGASGFRVSVAANAPEMRRIMQAGRPDVVMLDVMLPEEDGLALCRELRASSQLPVILLSARSADVDRIIGKEMGADDYVGKPFNPGELLARLKALLRRSRALGKAQADSQRVRFAGWTLDLAARHLLDGDGVVVPLSGGEFRLLAVFVEHANRVLDRNLLMDLALGREATPFDRSIDVQVSRLRQRLRDDGREPRIIKTVRNSGYVLAAAVERLA